MLALKPAPPNLNLRSSIPWLITALFVGIFILELLTPPDYIFGYFYIGPILLANFRLGRKATLIATLAAVVLTLLNLYVPGHEIIEPSTIASRMIATLALVVTGILSDRNYVFQQTVLQQQTQLQAQEKLTQLRDDFVATLTHDLKTPLLGAIETLKAFQQESFGSIQPAQYKVLATMVRSHQTTLQMVETLLDVYRNDSEGLVLDLAPVDLGEIAETVMTEILDLATSRRIHLSLNHGASDFRQTLWVKGDTLQLQRVIANLLTNAINHSPRGGKVEMVLESGSTHQTLKVLDRGAGVKADEIPYLFERFYQGQSDHHAKGAGLGLYLSRQIVAAHGGTIWAEKRDSMGSSFAFRLPTIAHPAAVPYALEGRSSAQNSAC